MADNSPLTCRVYRYYSDIDVGDEIKQDQKVSEADPPNNQKVPRSVVSKLGPAHRNSKVNM